MPFLREIILAGIGLVALTWHLVYASRRSTFLSAGLGLITTGFGLQLLLNVNQLERWLEDTTNLQAVSSLLKNLVFAIVSVGCVLIWHLAGRSAWQKAMSVVIATYVAVAILSWATSAKECPFFEGLKYDKCALQSPLPVATEIAGLTLVGCCGILTAWMIRSLAGVKTRERRSALLLIVAVLVSVAWAFTAAAGVFDVYRTGDLSYFQYLVRTPLAATAALLVYAAVLYTPVAHLWTAIRFSLKGRHVLYTLGVRRTQAIVAGGSANFAVVDVMDALGEYLHDKGVRVRPGNGMDGMEPAADLLLEKSSVEELSVPVDGGADVQRRWLLGVARLMERE